LRAAPEEILLCHLLAYCVGRLSLLRYRRETYSPDRLRDHKAKLAKFIKERQAWREQAERLLKTVDAPRTHRATIFQTENRLKELMTETEALQKANDGGKSPVRALDQIWAHP